MASVNLCNTVILHLKKWRILKRIADHKKPIADSELSCNWLELKLKIFLNPGFNYTDIMESSLPTNCTVFKLINYLSILFQVYPAYILRGVPGTIIICAETHFSPCPHFAAFKLVFSSTQLLRFYRPCAPPNLLEDDLL